MAAHINQTAKEPKRSRRGNHQQLTTRLVGVGKRVTGGLGKKKGLPVNAVWANEYIFKRRLVRVSEEAENMVI